MHGQQNVKMNNYFFCAGFEHVVYGPWDEVQFRVFLYLASIHFCLSVPRTDVTYLTHLVVWGNFFCFVLLCAYIRNLIPRPCVPFSRNVIRKRKICVKKRGGGVVNAYCPAGLHAKYQDIFRRKKATISFVMSVSLSVRMEQLGLHWTDF